MRRPLGIGIGVLVGLQFLVPAALLLSPRMSAFGWQMFAERVSVTSVESLDADGQDVAVSGWVTRMRPEVRWEQVAPPHLCQEPRVTAVRVTFSDGDELMVQC